LVIVMSSVASAQPCKTSSRGIAER